MKNMDINFAALLENSSYSISLSLSLSTIVDFCLNLYCYNFFAINSYIIVPSRRRSFAFSFAFNKKIIFLHHLLHLQLEHLQYVTSSSSLQQFQSFRPTIHYLLIFLPLQVFYSIYFLPPQFNLLLCLPCSQCTNCATPHKWLQYLAYSVKALRIASLSPSTYPSISQMPSLHIF